MEALDYIYGSMILAFVLAITCFVLPFAPLRGPHQYDGFQRRYRVPLLVAGGVLLVVSAVLFLSSAAVAASV